MIPTAHNEIHVCWNCKRGWEYYGSTLQYCEYCKKPREIFYRHYPLERDQSQYNYHLDKLRGYLEKDPMSKEPMEELDFSPLQAIIDGQEGVIDELKERIEELENKVTELESDLADRYDALVQIERLAGLYV